MNNYTVYIHRNKINNKTYIGITKQKPEDRWREGLGYKTQKKFWKAIQKYGWNNFEHIIFSTNLSEKEASLLEQDLIKKFDSIKNGYNVSPGGSTTNHSQETLEKMRQSMLGKKCSEQTKEKISSSQYHNNVKIKVYCLEKNKIYNSITEASKDTGIDKSSITRVCNGKQKTAGKFHWSFANEKPMIVPDKRYRPVCCITTKKFYQSISEAAKDTNSDSSNIKKVCDGKYKTTNKLKWRYATDIEILEKRVING